MDNDKQLCIGFTHFDPRFAFFWSIVGHCAKEEAERLGVKLISKPAPNVADQIIEIQKLLEQKVDALLITPIESGHPGLINLIERVNAAGIPVVALDSGIGGGEVMSTVRSDNIKGAEMVTEYIFERLGGKGKVVHLQGDLKAEVGAHRSDGFHNVLNRYPEIELVFEVEGNWYRDRGAELTQQALAQHPDIRAVIAGNDLTALGASDVIAKVGRTKEILVAGFDALPEALLSIYEGQMTATIRQDANGIACESLQAAVQGIRGEAVPSLLLTKVELITLDNLLKTSVEGLHMLPGVLRNLEEQKREISKANAMLEQHRDQLEELVADRTRDLTRQQYILDTFMENVPDRIYFKDVQSRITRTNRAFAIKLGVQDPGELIGKSDFDFFPADQAEVKYQQEQELIKTGQPILGLEEPDGIDRWALTTKMPLLDEKGVIMGTFGISRDITELVKAKQASEAAVKEAEKARALAEIEKEKAEAAKNEAEKAHHAMEIANQTLAAQMWQTTGQALLNEKMRGEQDVPTLANNVIQHLCKYLETHNGTIYILEDNILRLTGTYAYRRKSLVQQYQVGEDRVGQAAVEKEIILEEIPDDYIALSLRQGKLLPKYNLVAPVVYNQQVSGVITLESMTKFNPAQMGFLERAIESVAIAFMTAQARTRVNELYTQTRQQAEELQAQEEELRATNEELEAQTENLRASETRLKANQAALEAANVDLEEKTHNLQEKQAILDRQNQVLRDAQQELEHKAEELTVTNKYKSEFLANMSHELRTPLNSLLILSRMLADNEGGNLTADQVESAQIISASGADLLNLINEILDLSKVEAGHMNFNFAPMLLENLAQSMRVQFEHVAEEKGLKYEVSLGSGLPESITTDQQRVEQVVKNLLSNAFKFTEKGAVQLRIEPEGEMIAIRVRDSGIGMTPEQQQRVFEAFQQADGSTSRKYGGTGLGLTISREMSIKLGGRIGLESKPGKGSLFTLYLPRYRPTGEVESTPAAAPVSSTVPAAPAKKAPATVSVKSKPVNDDREKIQKGDKLLLVIEDDAKFAKVLFDYAHKKDFKCILAEDGESGLKLAGLHPPDAILLDLKLPGMSGWEVLDTLKGDASLRHIPVHILSATSQTMDAYKRGALGFLSKPISQDQLDGVFATIGDFLSRDIKSLLIVEDDNNLRYSVRQLLGGSDVKISEAASGEAALALLRKTRFDCMILDLSLPDMTGFELLNKINQDETVSKCPVIVYTGKALSEEENEQLLKYASSVIIKGVKSPERLLDETALFLHRVVADMPAEKQDTIHRLHDHNAVFSGKHILVVDDDMRNAFALSRLLSDRELRVTVARSGAKALETLDNVPDIDLVLMDIMMPEMDGYETMQKVRAQLKFKNLPILALTAKAMKGDQEKCIAAGANDYLSKPVDADRLFSMLRVWLYR